ncbi:hypothetical protein N836_03190 [Leptolyngbya sp. Heron Island J]|uniref:hypothetical protein n=1 Tax=Leptolyngbya sp. Heron Island J TaxID=1385935 RepID=UPI0003B9B908|nr:hypothetical protein [Leptolyngbya sp. Heron Island J]ESA37409.1 hypothetical protein N836_03190 [Leptolyngbya sp. Heron Island J]
MTNQHEDKDRVLDAVRNLAHAANGHLNLVSAVSEYINATSLLSISKLEYWERTFRYEIYVEPHSRSKSFSLREHRLLIPWLDHCNGNGYLREKALRSLREGAPNGFLFAMILRRLNDWVPQVRAAAREHVPQIAANTKPEFILETLWAILPYLHTWGRLQDEDLEVLISLLSIDGIPSRLASKLVEVTAGPAASILGQAGRKPVLDKFLSTISEEAVQPAVRAKAYLSQLEERMVWFEGRKWVWTDIRWCEGRYEPVLGERAIKVNRSFLETLKKAARDSSPVVRRVAGNVLLTKLDSIGTEALPIAEILSKDSYPSVVERGKFVLARLKA